MLQVMRILAKLKTEAGNPPDDMYFVSRDAAPCHQLVLDLHDGDPVTLWSPGKDGVTSVRKYRYQPALVGVFTTASGRGTHLVTTPLRPALLTPARLADLDNWRRLSGDVSGKMGIVSLSRPHTTDDSMQLCAMLSKGDEARVSAARIIYLQGDLCAKTSGVLPDAPYKTSHVILGRLPSQPKFWMGYSCVGSGSGRETIEVTLRAEIPANPLRPFEASLPTR